MNRIRRRHVSGIMAALLVVISVIIAVVFSPDLLSTEEPVTEPLGYFDYPMHVSFIDVGQGDCSLYSCNGVNILVDGGEREYATDVLNYLDMAGIDKIDCYILSHPHSDHIGCAADIIEEVEVDKIFTTYFSEFNMPTTSCYERLLDVVSEKSIQMIDVISGDSFTFGEVEIDILAPIYESDDYNDMSIVFTATYEDITVLYTGDTTSTVEKQMLEKGMDVDADIIKIAHHGSTTSSTAEFIDAVSPSVAVISCGKNNSYGHPHDEIIDLLQSRNIPVNRTDTDGSVVCYGDGNYFITGGIR